MGNGHKVRCDIRAAFSARRALGITLCGYCVFVEQMEMKWIIDGWVV